mmetsp:Transcript_16933/g.23685  ORF Transcript_16933/g.23685 Transcript_16933/m.23685 type:complete len:215 (-) Transcript_16933:187-831(-)
MAVEAFSLTYVVYDGGVSGHKVLALITLCPIFLIVAYLTLIYSRRQIQTIIMLIGQLANEAANSVLKQHIKESRPEACAHEGYGMPSSHSQFMGFFAAYCLISSIRWENNDFISHKVLGNLSIMSLACLVMYSRVELGYHTFAQVYVGGVLGCLFALFWFFLIDAFVEPYMAEVQNSSICNFFYFRDSKKIPNLHRFEYECACTRADVRIKKAS